jgi:hypothetical protein
MTCQRSAGTLKVFEGLPLPIKVIVARKTKTPQLMARYPTAIRTPLTSAGDFQQIATK